MQYISYDGWERIFWYSPICSINWYKQNYSFFSFVCALSTGFKSKPVTSFVITIPWKVVLNSSRYLCELGYIWIILISLIVCCRRSSLSPSLRLFCMVVSKIMLHLVFEIYNSNCLSYTAALILIQLSIIKISCLVNAFANTKCGTIWNIFSWIV